MARDIYVKFGESKEKDKYGRPMPIIEGDSSDDEHFYWTEAQSCSFGMSPHEVPDEDTATESSEDDSTDTAKKTRTKLGAVSLSKKVDWGSARLYQLACEAPEALKKRTLPDSDKGQIETVIVEVCRRSGVESEGRIPYLTVKFYGVYVTSYEISFSGPDPVETIEFQYCRLEFTYIWMDPFTGGKAGEVSAKGLVSYPKTPVPQVAASVAELAAAFSPVSSPNFSVTITGDSIIGGLLK